MKDFTGLVDLASERVGGRVLAANDEFFAPKGNLLKASKPVFIEGKYTSRGKWMDGWETRRRREPGHDWCIVRLGLPGIVRGVVVDTSHFKGNFPESCSIEACAVDRTRSLKQLTGPATAWVELLPKTRLQGDTQNLFAVSDSRRFTHLRLNIYPDGGVARLRVHGEVVPDETLRQKPELDLVAVETGARVVASSYQFFGSPQNLLLPGRAKNMGDGWETRRRRGPGFDWVILKLGFPGEIRRIEVDTTHFKGNFPESCSLEACSADPAEADAGPLSAAVEWKEILPRTKLKANARHIFQRGLRATGSVYHVRFNIFPDGGVARLRIFGTPSRGGNRLDGLRRLNSLSKEEAEVALLDCCGSKEWVRQMISHRPFDGVMQLFDAADSAWASLGAEDWFEAFHHHPPIGAKKAKGAQSAAARRWSAKEQSGVQRSSRAILVTLAEANRTYHEKFGYIFIICATGKTTEEILSHLQRRLGNAPESELRVAAEEQRQITHLRLEKLLER
jgi:allantoicase